MKNDKNTFEPSLKSYNQILKKFTELLFLFELKNGNYYNLIICNYTEGIQIIRPSLFVTEFPD